MKNILSLIVISLPLISSCGIDHKQCRELENKTHRQAVIYQLEQNNVQYTLSEHGQICMTPEFWNSEEYESIRKEVNSYYRDVATPFSTQEQAKRMALWLEKENIQHRFSVTSDGIFLVIFSANPEDAENNRNKMNEILVEK